MSQIHGRAYAMSYGITTHTPTPTISPTPIPTITPSPLHTSTCDNLTVISGNNTKVPANVTFRVRGSDNKGNIQSYRFFYGDGRFDESSSTEVTHRYESSGTFIARAEILDSAGNWKGSSSCESTVTVLSAPIETHKSACSDLFITEGDNTQAPTTARFTITGYDNKGTLKRYKVEFGDGTSEDKTDNRFEKRYNTAGTYTVRGYVLDSRDNWRGGSGSCEKILRVTTTPLTKQPSTGTPTVFTLAAFTGGIWSTAFYTLRRRLGLH